MTTTIVLPSARLLKELVEWAELELKHPQQPLQIVHDSIGSLIESVKSWEERQEAFRKLHDDFYSTNAEDALQVRTRDWINNSNSWNI